MGDAAIGCGGGTVQAGERSSLRGLTLALIALSSLGAIACGSDAAIPCPPGQVADPVTMQCKATSSDVGSGQSSQGGGLQRTGGGSSTSGSGGGSSSGGGGSGGGSGGGLFSGGGGDMTGAGAAAAATAAGAAAAVITSRNTQRSP